MRPRSTFGCTTKGICKVSNDYLYMNIVVNGDGRWYLSSIPKDYAMTQAFGDH